MFWVLPKMMSCNHHTHTNRYHLWMRHWTRSRSCTGATSRPPMCPNRLAGWVSYMMMLNHQWCALRTSLRTCVQCFQGKDHLPLGGHQIATINPRPNSSILLFKEERFLTGLIGLQRCIAQCSPFAACRRGGTPSHGVAHSWVKSGLARGQRILAQQ